MVGADEIADRETGIKRHVDRDIVASALARQQHRRTDPRGVGHPVRIVADTCAAQCARKRVSIGYTRKDQHETDVRFELIAQTYERRSLINTSN